MSFVVDDIIWLNTIVEKLAEKLAKIGNKALIITARDMNNQERKKDMKKSKHKEISILEASDYFDEHDIFEFEDVKEVTDIKFKLQKKKYVGLDMEIFKKIRNKAKKLHKSEDLLIKEWLLEKVG